MAKAKLFDLNDGDIFYDKNKLKFEVVSPLGTPGLTHFFGYLAGTVVPAGKSFTCLKKNKVYAIQPDVNRHDIYTFNENYTVEV